MNNTLPILAIIILTFMSLGSVRAEEMMITTEFKPSATNPDHNEFVNTTEVTGFCKNYPAQCKNGAFSIETAITAENRVLDVDSTDNRDHTYQRVDSNWRPITLYDRITRKEISVLFRISLMSHRFARTTNSWQNTDFNQAGAQPIGGCIGTTAMVTTGTYEYAWLQPEGINVCNKPVNNISYTDVKMDRISIGYEIQSPNPMSAQNGDYIGSISYSVGYNGDIDLGNADYSDNELKITINASVRHEFKVEPKGPLKVVLEPEGGWESIRGGVTEAQLEGRSSFALTASAPFGMYAECEHNLLGTCAMKMEGSDSLAPLTITVSMPGMRSRLTGEIVNNMNVPMKTDSISQFIIEPLHYNNATESPIVFRVNASGSRAILAAPGSTWKGAVTLVFDSDLPFLP